MFTNPVKNLKAFGVRETDIVADLGAGTGFYTIALAPMVPNGKVYAVEIEKDFLTTIKNNLKHARIHNVECLLGDIERPGGTKLGTGILDKVIASNVLFQIEAKDKFIEEVKRILKPEGEVMLIDWSPDGSILPIKSAVPPSEARAMFERAGFVFERDLDAGAHHYGMIFKRP